jgi:hypothetical protein
VPSRALTPRSSRPHRLQRVEDRRRVVGEPQRQSIAIPEHAGRGETETNAVRSVLFGGDKPFDGALTEPVTFDDVEAVLLDDLGRPSSHPVAVDLDGHDFYRLCSQKAGFTEMRM